MGAFEDGDFIIVGLDPDAAQWRFSTTSPSGFPEHRKRCLSSCLCLHTTLSRNICASTDILHLKMRLLWQTCSLALACWIIAFSIVSVSTVTRELQSYLYNRQNQLNVRKSGFICKTSALLCDLVPKYKPGRNLFIIWLLSVIQQLL